MRWLKRFICNESGAVALEMAWVGTFMSLMMIALVDLSDVVYSAMKLSAGVGTCVPYAIQNPTDTSGMTTVLQRSSGLDADKLSITTTEFCECNGNASECTAACTKGIEKYVTLKVSYLRPLIFSYPGVDNPYNIDHEQTVRIQ